MYTFQLQRNTFHGIPNTTAWVDVGDPIICSSRKLIDSIKLSGYRIIEVPSIPMHLILEAFKDLEQVSKPIETDTVSMCLQFCGDEDFFQWVLDGLIDLVKRIMGGKYHQIAIDQHGTTIEITVI